MGRRWRGWVCLPFILLRLVVRSKAAPRAIHIMLPHTRLPILRHQPASGCGSVRTVIQPSLSGSILRLLHVPWLLLLLLVSLLAVVGMLSVICMVRAVWMVCMVWTVPVVVCVV